MSKQIILTALVDNLGAEGDTVTVADGYARNFLIPKGLAMPATPGNLRRVESLRKKREASLAAQLEDAKTAATQLVKQSYTITAAAGEDGKLYGSGRDRGGPAKDRAGTRDPRTGRVRRRCEASSRGGDQGENLGGRPRRRRSPCEEAGASVGRKSW